MDQAQLQEKIALYYQKLPEETKVLFAGMSWLEILKEIDTKYSLDDEQIKTLGTETTILLLGIVSPDTYVDTIKTEIKIEEYKLNQMLDEIGEKILKDVAPFLYESFNNNVTEILSEKFGQNFDKRILTLPIKIQDAINDSHYQIVLYEIGNNFALNIDQIGTLEEVTIKVMAGVISPDRYEDEIKSKINMPDDKRRQMISQINEEVFKSIKDLMKINWDKTGNTKVPVPPYAKKEYVNPAPVISTSINKEPANKIETTTTISKSDSDLYKEHGIEILSEDDHVEPETKKQEIFTPSQNIVADKLFSKTVSPSVTTDYSLPKINTQIQPQYNVKEIPLTKPHDPYHEII